MEQPEGGILSQGGTSVAISRLDHVCGHQQEATPQPNIIVVTGYERPQAFYWG